MENIIESYSWSDSENLKVIESNCLFGGEISSENKFSIYNIERPYYILVYVVKGKGKLICNGVEFDVEQNQTMYGRPNAKYTIISDEEDPWHLIYVVFKGFDGEWLLSKTNFSVKNPVSPPIPNLEPIYNVIKVEKSTEKEKEFEKIRANIKLFYLLSYYMEFYPINEETCNPFVKKAKEYIDLNYKDHNCTVSKVLSIVKVDRSYLFKLFKKEIGFSVQEYINSCRMKKAEVLIVDSKSQIKDVAFSVGYIDQLYFSKMFKKYFGLSPTDYRKTKKKVIE